MKPKYLLLTSLISVAAAGSALSMDSLDAAEGRLNTVYWRIYRELSHSSQLRLKASELEWIAWKDDLGATERYYAVVHRIAWLETFEQ